MNHESVRSQQFPPPPPLDSEEVLNSIQLSIKSMSSRYKKVTPQNVDIRYKVICKQIISDTETLLSDELISNLSSAHKKYLKDILCRSINQVRTVYQEEAAAYDPTLPSNRRSTANSILPFLIRQPRRLDNKDPLTKHVVG